MAAGPRVAAAYVIVDGAAMRAQSPGLAAIMWPLLILNWRNRELPHPDRQSAEAH